MAPRVGERRYQLFAHWGGFKGPPAFFSLWDRRTHECIGEVSVDLVMSLLERLIMDGTIQAQFQGELSGEFPVRGPPPPHTPPPLPESGGLSRAARRPPAAAPGTGPPHVAAVPANVGRESI